MPKFNLKESLNKFRASDYAAKGELVEPTSYEFSPSFVYHNGIYSTTVQLYVRSGSNRSLAFDDILGIIPTSPREGIKIYLIEVDGIIKDEEKKTVIKKNITSTKKAIEHEEEHAQKDKASGKFNPLLTHEKDASERETDRANMEDFYDYEMLLDSPEPIVYFRITMRITGTSREAIDEQIADLNTIFNQRYAGMKLDSTAGDQRMRFLNTFAPLPKKENVDSSPARNYAGLNFAASPALCDNRGVVIGDDVMSLVGSSAVFDFEGSTKAERPAIIAVPKSESLPIYNGDVPVSSIAAQAAVNDIVLNGHKAAHIVLNGFNYLSESHGFVRPVSSDAFAYYDAQKMTINPLQGFGKVEEVTQIFPRLTRKLVNMFDLLNDYAFEIDAQTGLELKGIIAEAVNGFYVRNNYWTADAAINPARTNIVNVKHPEAYATMGSLIQSFTNIEEGSRRKGSINIADKAYSLHNILEGALTESRDILGRATSIVPSKALQTYYDLSNIPNRKMKNVQFLNILDYVIWTLNVGDVLVIHGVDNLDKFLMTNMVAETLRAASAHGIKIIFVFDTIEAPKLREYDGSNPSDAFSLKGAYYTDFGKDLSWSMMGAMLDNELKRYAEVMNNVRLSDVITANANTRGVCQVLLHRDVGDTNNFIQLACVI